MKKLLLIICFYIALNLSAMAQSIINGSFENNSGSCLVGLTNSAYSAAMYNSVAFGTAGQLDILNDPCSYGFAQDGTWFIGMAVDNSNTLTDAFSLELSTPMTAGNEYTLSFYNRKHASYNTNMIEIGISDTDTVFGTQVYVAPVPGLSWDLNTVTFTPAFNAQYITVRTIAGTYGWNHVDNFRLEIATAAGNGEAMNAAPAIYPNPFAAQLRIKGCSRQHSEAAISLFDYRGKKVICVNSQSPETILNTENLAAGLSFLRVEDGEGVRNYKMVKQ
jgi:hypothetical protein